MAAVLSCGPDAFLSHDCGAGLLGIRPVVPDRIEISVPAGASARRRGIVIHRRATLRPEDVTEHEGIPVTRAVCTLVDIAPRLERGQLEAAIGEADKRGLTSPEELRAALDGMPRRPGLRKLREVLDSRTFVLTDSELERRFLPLARAAGLPEPATQRHVNGFRVDFFWPELGLVVETDGLRYHRTPIQQQKDRVRDQVHTAAGLTPLRFTHAQVSANPAFVTTTLAAVSRRLARRQSSPT